MKVDFICKNCGAKEEDEYEDQHAKTLTELLLCFDCNHWFNLFKAYKGRKPAAIIKGNHYVIAPDSGPGSLRGHGGAMFKIKFFAGEVVTTRNLWHQGEIPAVWQPVLKDNAEFVKEVE